MNGYQCSTKKKIFSSSNIKITFFLIYYSLINLFLLLFNNSMKAYKFVFYFFLFIFQKITAFTLFNNCTYIFG